jgi:virulence-associated protein VapD
MAGNFWAIAYDLDVKQMKDAGYTKSNVTQFYNSVRECLTNNHFEKMKQLSIYTSGEANSISDAFAACMALQKVTDADKFIKRLHLFRVEDFNDLLPLVASGKFSAERDVVEEQIEEVYGSEHSAVAQN